MYIGLFFIFANTIDTLHQTVSIDRQNWTNEVR